MRSPTVAVLTAFALVTGCGGAGVEPAAWARRVCRALKPWSTEITALTRQAQQEMASTTSPQQTRDNLVRLFGGAEQASERARQQVHDAGVPAVDDGERIAEEFAAALSAARDAYRRAGRSVEALATTNAKAFYDGVVATMDQLNREYSQTGLDTSKVSSEELQRAFDEEPECR